MKKISKSDFGKNSVKKTIIPASDVTIIPPSKGTESLVDAFPLESADMPFVAVTAPNGQPGIMYDPGPVPESEKTYVAGVPCTIDYNGGEITPARAAIPARARKITR